MTVGWKITNFRTHKKNGPTIPLPISKIAAQFSLVRRCGHAKNAQLEEGAKNPQLGEQKPRNVSVRTVVPQKLVQTSNQRTRNQLNNLRDGWFYTSREPGQGRTWRGGLRSQYQCPLPMRKHNEGVGGGGVIPRAYRI